VITIQESVIADILGEMLDEDLDEDVYEEGEEAQSKTPYKKKEPILTPPKKPGGKWTYGPDTVEDKVKREKKKKAPLKEEDLEEQSKTDTPDRVAGRDTGGRRLTPLEEEAADEEEKKPVERVKWNPKKDRFDIPPPAPTAPKPPEEPVTIPEALQQQLQAYEQNYAQLYESHQVYEHNYAQLHQQAGMLHEQNDKFRKLLVKTQGKLNEVNVQNAQLYYTNRTLTSDSLNERQKDKIVEAIERAGTVEETKIIFETLQSTVAGLKPNQNTPKSLNEAINKRSSAFLPRQREEKHSDPTLVDRMQKLAGIK
jgi:hypothetical protein